MPEALEFFYVDRIFDRAKKSAAVDVGDRVRAAVVNDLSSSDWMDEETKKKIKDKVGNVVFNVGYPDEMYDKGKKEKRKKDPYRKLKFYGDNYFVNVHRALKVRFDNRFRNSR